MKKLFSIFLLLAVAISSVGMSVTQHFCTMSKEEIEASMCDMCAMDDHGEAEMDEKSCCSNEAVHMRVDTEATSAKAQATPQPIISEPLFDLVFDPTDALPFLQGPTRIETLPAFPLTEEHTVLRV